MRYLDEKQILLIHSMLIDQTGGAHGLRDKNRLHSVVSAIQQPYYESKFEKAALLARNIIQDHPFVDGNKRTGITSAIVFLEMQGIKLQFKIGEIEDYAVAIAVENFDVAEIAEWLEAHAKKRN